MVASVADRASQRPKTVTSQGVFLARAATSLPTTMTAQNVVPVAVTAGDRIEGLRQWASGRCLSADRAGVYSRTEGVSGGRVRRVVREPGVN
jgi:hypothetical protein